MVLQPEVGVATRVSVTGTIAITSGNAQILGWMCAASVTQGSIQVFANTTTSASITPVIPILTTGAYTKFPALVSGAGLTIKFTGTLDPNLTFFWAPVGGP